MPHRVNVVLRDEIWSELERLPKGSRSQAVNDALAEWLERARRRAAGQRIDEIRAAAPSLDIDIVELVRQDRDRAQ